MDSEKQDAQGREGHIIYISARVKGEILQKNTCLATQKNILNYFFLYL